MPRTSRASRGKFVDHALYRGNDRSEPSHNDEDFTTFVSLMRNAHEKTVMRLTGCHLMSNHYYLVLRPLIDGEMSRCMGWIGGTHLMRCDACYHTSGPGHLYQQRYKSFPIQELDTVRLAAHPGRPLGVEAGGIHR